jgi:hypothetical protein
LMFAIISTRVDVKTEIWHVETYVWLVFCEIGHTSGTSDIALGNTRKFWGKKSYLCHSF